MTCPQNIRVEQTCARSAPVISIRLKPFTSAQADAGLHGLDLGGDQIERLVKVEAEGLVEIGRWA